MKFINPAFGVVRACASTRSATSSNTHFGLFLLPAYSNNAPFLITCALSGATPPLDPPPPLPCPFLFRQHPSVAHRGRRT